jgi:hypothetical protein
LIGPFHGSETPLVAAWALKVADERRRVKKTTPKPACPRLPALKLGGLYGRAAAEVNATEVAPGLRKSVQKPNDLNVFT